MKDDLVKSFQNDGQGKSSRYKALHHMVYRARRPKPEEGSVLTRYAADGLFAKPSNEIFSS